VDISPSGAHFVVHRNEPEQGRINHINHYVEIDGVAGPMFDTLAGSAWSEDGNEYLYGGRRQKPTRPTGRNADPYENFVVYKEKLFGPYDEVRGLAVANGGRWALITRGIDPTKEGFQWTLILSGSKVPIPQGRNVVEQMFRFDKASDKFVYKATTQVPEKGWVPQWFNQDGAVIPEPEWAEAVAVAAGAAPTRPASQPAAKPAGLDVKVTVTSKRLSLTINGMAVGTYDHVESAHVDGKQKFAFPQPDGRVAVYVVRYPSLIRLKIRPPATPATPPAASSVPAATRPATGPSAVPF
jgi:hypothetical protein